MRNTANVFYPLICYQSSVLSVPNKLYFIFIYGGIRRYVILISDVTKYFYCDLCQKLSFFLYAGTRRYFIISLRHFDLICDKYFCTAIYAKKSSSLFLFMLAKQRHFVILYLNIFIHF